MEISTFFSKKNIVITGSTGYIGHSLIQNLSQFDCKIIRFLRAPTKPWPYPNIYDLVADLTDFNAWKEIIHTADIVYYLAGETSLQKCEENPMLSLKSHLVPLIQLTEAVKKTKAHPIVIHAGTATQVGLPSCFMIDESTPDNPITQYDLHKLWAEQHLKLSAQNNIIKTTTLRFSNVYGPGIFEKNQDRGIINKILKQALSEHQITLYGDGNYLRNYIYIDDVIQALLLAATHIESLNRKHCLICHNDHYLFHDVFHVISDLVNSHSKKSVLIKSSPWPQDTSPIQLRNYKLCNALFKKNTPWKPTISLKEGLFNMLTYSNGVESI